MHMSEAPYITQYKDSKDFWFVGGLARVLGESSRTNGNLSFMHFTHRRGDSSPLHVHHKHDEAFFVLHGDVWGVLGESEWEATSGSFIWLPRSVPHAFQAISEIPLEMLVMTTPGGLDEFVANAGDPYEEGMDTANLSLDPALLASIAIQHDIEILGPPINFLG